MRSIDISISHDDNPMVSKLREIHLFFVDPHSQGRDNRLNLLVGEHLIESGLFYVKDLPFKGKDSLMLAIPPLFGRTTCRVSLNDIDFTADRIPFLAVRQFAGEKGGIHPAFFPG